MKIKYEDYFIVPTGKQKKLLAKTIDLAMKFYDGSLRDNKFLVYRTPRYFFDKLNRTIPCNPSDVEKSFDLLEEVGKYSISQFDKTYLSFPDSGNSLPGMMGAIFAKLINQNLCAFDRSAPIATVMEIQIIEWLRELIGYKSKELKDIKSLSEVGGMCVSGGHMANHIGVMAALNNKFPEIREKGLAKLGFTPVILLSNKISHYSFLEAAHHLGIGRDSVVDIPTTQNFTTNYEKLEQVLKDLPRDKVPFMVVGVAGNTKTSNLDNLGKLADFTKKHNLWLHVDACHGGSLLFSKKMKKQFLSRIEQADSVTIDPHKGLFVPYPSSYILFKRRDVLSFFSKHPEETKDKNIWELGLITPFYGSRGFESLSLWMLISVMGTDGIAQVVEYRSKIAKYTEELIESADLFIGMNKMDFYRMAFVYCPKRIREYLVKFGDKLSQPQKVDICNLINRYDREINQKLYTGGEVCLDKYSLYDVGNKVRLGDDKKFLVMAITIGNPLFTEETMKKALNKLFNDAKKLVPLFEKDFLDIINSKTRREKHCRDFGGPAGW
ncbi:hypothetical protein A3A71_01155 [Candidatus Berkelbacteria bacterium RIFCSPLOWO2_01_FULL_50_28]|uniref:Pyridoxal-dependent decarboxylase n=1 Tax=Candidatus Berkelbacteria bacterium RIFCSPLOWO2_01_FULL_50_28 TaxID=1797471 RepID=A0A1F5EB81_9BACT|nr:MAG: hypothetical protein A2807_01725 [Candidatus Berkelbacteria bacterium RIFCSPHIGHO2_01_FULL_50_36]OGD63485.1 MAG: hypothetical protein A3F39_03310 [Candidatus Berkelbacteria bacterium RIFCSPHIGHO2_12_FULL_50_11]OGD64645.1 MAG: hypothetical protein A3A71_01155 [Candidatus Berkelbacteria bacterium RIFCSPLOWO2_01_FULL_50_28]